MSTDEIPPMEPVNPDRNPFYDEPIYRQMEVTSWAPDIDGAFVVARQLIDSHQFNDWPSVEMHPGVFVNNATGQNTRQYIVKVTGTIVSKDPYRQPALSE